MGGTSIDQLMEIDNNSHYSSRGEGVMDNYRDQIVQQRNINEFVSELNKQKPREEIHEPEIELDDLLEEPEIELQQDNGWWELIRDPLIILVLYFILSQSFVFNGISKVIPQLIPTETGVSNLGILIYGIILGILFMVVKKLV